MKLIITLASLLITMSISAKDIHFGIATVVTVTSIYDADTFRADINGYPPIIGENMSIRVNGIDAAEMRGKCDIEKQKARAAKQFTVDKLRSAKSIILKNMKRGKYFRIIADVYIDGQNLGDLLIKHKHAVKYNGGTRISWC